MLFLMQLKRRKPCRENASLMKNETLATKPLLSLVESVLKEKGSGEGGRVGGGGSISLGSSTQRSISSW